MCMPYYSMTWSILPAPNLDYHKMLSLESGCDISGVNCKYWSSEPLFSALNKPSTPPGLSLRGDRGRGSLYSCHHCLGQGWEQPPRTVSQGAPPPRTPSRQAGMRAASPAPRSHLGLNISSAVWEPIWHERGINTGLTIASGTGRSWTPAAQASIAKINML